MRRFSHARSTKARSNALTHDDGIAGADGNPHLGGIEAGCLTPLRFTPEAAGRESLPIPAVVTENTIGLGDDVPALNIADRSAIVRPCLDVAMAQLGFQLLLCRPPRGRR